MKGPVYGKMGFGCLEPCRLAEKCIRATVCRVGDDLRQNWALPGNSVGASFRCTWVAGYVQVWARAGINQ